MPTVLMRITRIEYAPNEVRLTAVAVNGPMQGTLTIASVGKGLLRMFEAGDPLLIEFRKANT